MCPSVVRNQFLGSGQYFASYLTYIVVHEMVHFYLGTASLGVSTDPPETYPINDVIALDMTDSIHNPMNYQFYLASEYYDIIILVTELRLTAFSGTAGMHSISGPQFATFSPSSRNYLCIHR